MRYIIRRTVKIIKTVNIASNNGKRITVTGKSVFESEKTAIHIMNTVGIEYSAVVITVSRVKILKTLVLDIPSKR